MYSALEYVASLEFDSVPDRQLVHFP